ncbi:TVP38/TMEM64 family protein [Phormidium tenue FACHB-886]|nr:TVP38/TMEM64 family protein [Phormidium tenue FACHB-886]
MRAGWLRSRKFWLLVLGGILIALLGSTLPLKDWFVAVSNWLIALGPGAMPAFIVLYLLATVLGFPNILLILVAGTIFGLIPGIIAVSIADTLGAIACFLLGRTLARKRIKKWISKHPSFAQLDQAVGKKGWKILLLTRLSPLVPSNILNYGFSCTKVNFWQYCFFSWLGMLPVIALYVYLGSFGVALLQEGLTPRKLALQSVGIVLAIGAALYTTRIARKALTPECPVEKPPQGQEAEAISQNLSNKP